MSSHRVMWIRPRHTIRFSTWAAIFLAAELSLLVASVVYAARMRTLPGMRDTALPLLQRVQLANFSIVEFANLFAAGMAAMGALAATVMRCAAKVCRRIIMRTARTLV